MWIVRDFTLQLIDDNGETITPKEYLEKVLEGSKNMQDPKNKIRKLIKAYFKDRDCFTMVRPLTNEGQLQNLEELPNEKWVDIEGYDGLYQISNFKRVKHLKDSSHKNERLISNFIKRGKQMVSLYKNNKPKILPIDKIYNKAWGND